MLQWAGGPDFPPVFFREEFSAPALIRRYIGGSMAIIPPRPIGKTRLSPEALKSDLRTMVKFGPCGLGERAVYLNSFFIDRRYYVTYPDIRRIFKRIAMSKGGFTGKGAFGSIPYLVVLFRDGTERQFIFRFEEEVDKLLNRIKRTHPEIPTLSEAGEKRVAEERAKEEARYLKELSPEAENAILHLRSAKAWLEEEPEISDGLAYAARQKRVIDRMNPTYRWAAAAIFLLAAGAFVFGVISLLRHEGFAAYFVLFGIAFMFYTMSSQVLPTGRNNKRYANEQWQKALGASADRISCYGDGDFPVPAQYAHPAALDRMIRVIREGRARSVEEAWKIMKDELKAVNSDVTVSQTEYDEIVTIKPMFLLCGYEDISSD